jgi:hypothetical protein
MEKAAVLKGFNDHFGEFVEDLKQVFPGNEDLAALSSFVKTVRKANPRLAITAWNECVCLPYGEEIRSGNVSYFLEKDYSADLDGNESKDYIMQSIDQIRSPIAQLSEDDKRKAMQYIQNLTKLATLYAG